MAPKSPPKEFTSKELRFMDEYMIDCKAEAAAKRAGYAASTARTQAHTWVSKSEQNRKPHVADEIDRRRAALSEVTTTEAERVRAEFARIAFHRMSAVLRVDEYGHPVLDYSACTPEDLDNLAEVSNETVRERSGEMDEDGKPIYHTVKKVKVKNQDKISALKELARINGMYEKEAEQAAGALATAISEIQQRMSKAPIRRDVSQDDEA